MIIKMVPVWLWGSLLEEDRRVKLREDVMIKAEWELKMLLLDWRNEPQAKECGQF